MSDREITWEEWVEELSAASGGYIDYWLLDEESAKANRPNLYEYYKMGYDPNVLVSERLMSYEGGDVVIWLDPDDIDDAQLDAILANTEFYRTFSNEISSLRLLNDLTITDFNARRTLKRQIYVGTITCLETYLSDAFINTVLSNEEYLKSFFSSFKDFKEQKFGLNELFPKFEQAKDIAKKAMLEVIYHNLPKVKNMYETTLNLSFPNFAEITKHIATRHDLVHRNGKTKDEKEIFLDEKAVDEVICTIESFVNEIDRKLKGKEESPEPPGTA
ncbi:hypothetical protein F7734_23315 [Scytonema sp. UIC 10036]|uniref:hypothetical protein n=1 Tax=Scytonema sp. UIC 10036 TaxID=2304196 RepID=UPI0012DA7F81|nr:hypothetical protein [Scytonema sp. UIC 10036]MUG95130.1 hypothetical protein [Scytonema sp. UIC 10036]